jgi:SAM-dependent methyltransferase
MTLSALAVRVTSAPLPYDISGGRAANREWRDEEPLMSASGPSTSTYAMGRTESETRRLMLQATIYDPLMRRFLIEAGMTSGMNVLDLGSGAGDVAFVAADIVGQSGSVVGIDVNPDVLAVARQRAAGDGRSNVTFVVGDCRTASLPDDFDAVIGRYVLMYTGEPASTLKSVVNHVRPGGLVAFAEADFGPAVDFSRRAQSELVSRLWEWADDAFQHADNHPGMAIELHRAFLAAGLGAPEMLLQAPIGGGDRWIGYEWFAESMRSLVPLFERYEIATPAEVGVDTLADRMRSEILELQSLLMLLPMVTAWATKPAAQITIIQA